MSSGGSSASPLWPHLGGSGCWGFCRPGRGQERGPGDHRALRTAALRAKAAPLAGLGAHGDCGAISGIGVSAAVALGADWTSESQLGACSRAAQVRSAWASLGSQGAMGGDLDDWLLWGPETVPASESGRGRARPPGFWWGADGEFTTVTTTVWTTGARGPRSPCPQVRLACDGLYFLLLSVGFSEHRWPVLGTGPPGAGWPGGDEDQVIWGLPRLLIFQCRSKT